LRAYQHLANEKACAKRWSAEVAALKLKTALPKNVASKIVAEHLDYLDRRQVFARTVVVLRDAALLILQLKSAGAG